MRNQTKNTTKDRKKPTKELSLPKLLIKAQNIFNAWIRNRDKEKPCISCGTASVSEAGHFFEKEMYSALRFNEINVNGQCTRCNHFLSANLLRYRNGLINRVGEDKVHLLESAARNGRKTWSRLELEYIIQKYKSS